MSDNDDNNRNQQQQQQQPDEEDLYDEFGNYIGPELDDSSDEDDDDDSDEEEEQRRRRQQQEEDDDDDDDVASDVSHEYGRGMIVERTSGATDADPINSIVLHEDKEHYASATEVFGEDVRTAVLDEDTHDLDTPIVAPVVTKTHVVEEGSTLYQPAYEDEFLTKHLLSNETTTTRRGVAVVGHFHHGKTTLVDTLFESTLVTKFDPVQAATPEGRPHYTDVLKTEQQREMSLRSTPITLPLADTRGKSYAVTVIDCPGHTQFHDESVASLRLVDGVVLVVDAVEGIMLHTELLLKQTIAEGLPLVLCITKLDRLIVELQLPPRDAYYKLLNVIESINGMLESQSMGKYPPNYLLPTKNNVVFSSAQHGWLFTLESWTQTYLEHNENGLGRNVTIDGFATKLWGDNWYDTATRKFVDDPGACAERVERSFVQFVLEPIYKIYSTCLGESLKDVSQTMKSLGVVVKQEEMKSFSTRPLLRIVMSKFMELANCGFVDSIVKHV
jgi:U5 small nuclear ribonucleoprotein component